MSLQVTIMTSGQEGTDVTLTTVNEKRAAAKRLISLNFGGAAVACNGLESVEANVAMTKKGVLRMMHRAAILLPIPTQSGMKQEENSFHGVFTVGPETAKAMQANSANEAVLRLEMLRLCQLAIGVALSNCAIVPSGTPEDSLNTLKDALVGASPIDTFTGTYGLS